MGPGAAAQEGGRGEVGAAPAAAAATDVATAAAGRGRHRRRHRRRRQRGGGSWRRRRRRRRRWEGRVRWEGQWRGRRGGRGGGGGEVAAVAVASAARRRRVGRRVVADTRRADRLVRVDRPPAEQCQRPLPSSRPETTYGNGRVLLAVDGAIEPIGVTRLIEAVEGRLEAVRRQCPTTSAPAPLTVLWMSSGHAGSVHELALIAEPPADVMGTPSRPTHGVHAAANIGASSTGSRARPASSGTSRQ